MSVKADQSTQEVWIPEKKREKNVIKTRMDDSSRRRLLNITDVSWTLNNIYEFTGSIDCTPDNLKDVYSDVYLTSWKRHERLFGELKKLFSTNVLVIRPLKQRQ